MKRAIFNIKKIQLKRFYNKIEGKEIWVNVINNMVVNIPVFVLFGFLYSHMSDIKNELKSEMKSNLSSIKEVKRDLYSDIKSKFNDTYDNLKNVIEKSNDKVIKEAGLALKNKTVFVSKYTDFKDFDSNNNNK